MGEAPRKVGLLGVSTHASPRSRQLRYCGSVKGRGESKFLHVALAMAALCGCNAEETRPLLQVDVKTDYVPGEDFDSVRVEIGSGDLRVNLEHIVDLRGDYVRGRRIGSASVGEGEVMLVARMVQNGTVVASREVLASVRGTLSAVTIVITRNCGGLECPAPGGDAVLRSCYGGRCADPRCTVETPEFCPSLCTGDDECPTSGCRVGRCEVGVCFSVPSDEECEEGWGCRADGVCALVADAGASDGGLDAAAQDAGPDVGMECPCGARRVCVDARCEADSDDDGVADGDDCAPTDPSRFPGAPETCNGVDDDCDDSMDEGFALADETCNGIDDDCDSNVDESDVCEGCSPFSLGASRYLLCPRQRWVDASDQCRNMGFELATIETDAENAALVSRLVGGAWIGLNDRATEDTFVWADGSTATYRNWGLGEPNNSGNEDCVVLQEDMTWNDDDCPNRNPALCESPE